MAEFHLSLYPLEELRTLLSTTEHSETSPVVLLERVMGVGRPQSALVLSRDQVVVACLGVGIDREQIALTGPIVSTETLLRSVRSVLWRQAIDWCLSNPILAIQLAADDTTDDRVILSELGYSITTEIGVMTCREIPWLVDNDPDVEQRSLDDDRSQWVELVAGTFVETLDLPEAIPLRQPDAMIAGWQAEGGEVAWMARGTSGPAGLLVAHRQESVAEITYIGIVREARRCRWGTRLVAQFLKWCRDEGVTTVRVMIDRRNRPALALYRRLGFQESDLWMPVVFEPVTLIQEHAPELR